MGPGMLGVRSYVRVGASCLHIVLRGRSLLPSFVLFSLSEFELQVLLMENNCEVCFKVRGESDDFRSGRSWQWLNAAEA